MNSDTHLSSFVRSFVLSSRRDRWLDFLLNHRDKAFRNSSKLRSAIDQRYCKRVESIDGIELDTEGVFYNFYDSPILLPLSEALKDGDRRDAIFSIVPGELAIFFFHEGEMWLCKK
jgi:hypothetical protein